MCGTEFQPRYGKQRHCSGYCGSRHERNRGPRPETRKVERPSFDQLKADLDDLGSWTGVGRKYGVSDNAVRQWWAAYLRAEQDAA